MKEHDPHRVDESHDHRMGIVRQRYEKLTLEPITYYIIMKIF